ncbi:hypothetical protein F-S17_0079 [Faustovirus]|nr:hypothetical protein F-S17_0079 [Faustovirus]QJX72855.1 hypothetical protein F-VV57_0093 [Faustovirus]QJX73361.1 hypothetical protein F-VV63_0095 [Faustovirus]QJX73869.1 hypothetical protein F-E9_96 [Faustovirus]
MNAKRNSLVIIYQIPTFVNAAPVRVVNRGAMPASNISPRANIIRPMVNNNFMGGVTDVAVQPVVTPMQPRPMGMGVTWGVVNIIDGRVIMPTTTFDDPIYTYEGDLLLDYSYFVNENNVMKPVRSANMVEPVDVNTFRLTYDSANCILNIDNSRELTAPTTRMPSILTVVYMLAQRGYIDMSYSNCIINYCAVFDFCITHGAKLSAPLATGTVIIDTDRKSFHTIDPTKWDITSVTDVVIPYIAKEFYIMNVQTGVQRAIPFDKAGIKWCVIETTYGEKYEVLWEALVIYVEKLFTKL